MSGGSYNYLCHADLAELSRQREDLQAMIDRLRELGYEDASKESEYFQKLLDTEITRLEKIKDVWRAVEWLDSCDWGPDTLREAVEEWRAAL